MSEDRDSGDEDDLKLRCSCGEWTRVYVTGDPLGGYEQYISCQECGLDESRNVPMRPMRIVSITIGGTMLVSAPAEFIGDF